jgi:hypothetical protein
LSRSATRRISAEGRAGGADFADRDETVDFGEVAAMKLLEPSKGENRDGGTGIGGRPGSIGYVRLLLPII